MSKFWGLVSDVLRPPDAVVTVTETFPPPTLSVSVGAPRVAPTYGIGPAVLVDLMKDNDNGTYSCCYHPTAVILSSTVLADLSVCCQPGPYKVWVTKGAMHIRGSPFIALITSVLAGAASLTELSRC